ncbi:MAG: SHOCT domain-containing protein [Nakamurella sp.]
MGGLSGWHALMPLVELAFVVVAVGVVSVIAVFFLRRFGGVQHRESGPPPGWISARETLDQRYARGEIDTAEY